MKSKTKQHHLHRVQPTERSKTGLHHQSSLGQQMRYNCATHTSILCQFINIIYKSKVNSKIVCSIMITIVIPQATSRKNPKSGELNGNSATHHSADQQLKKMKEAERLERENIVLWKRPVTTLHYFTIELCLNIKEYAIK